MRDVARGGLAIALACAVVAMGSGCARRASGRAQLPEASKREVLKALESDAAVAKGGGRIEGLSFQAITEEQFRKNHGDALHSGETTVVRNGEEQGCWSFAASVTDPKGNRTGAIRGFLTPGAIFYEGLASASGPGTDKIATGARGRGPQEFARVAMLMIRFSPKKLKGSKDHYCRSILSAHHRSAALEAFDVFEVNASGEVSAETAVGMYRNWAAVGEARDRGDPFDVFTGPGPDGRFLAALFFDADAGRK